LFDGIHSIELFVPFDDIDCLDGLIIKVDTEILPAGLYTVMIEGIGEEELVRQVVVLP